MQCDCMFSEICDTQQRRDDLACRGIVDEDLPHVRTGRHCVCAAVRGVCGGVEVWRGRGRGCAGEQHVLQGVLVRAEHGEGGGLVHGGGGGGGDERPEVRTRRPGLASKTVAR